MMCKLTAEKKSNLQCKNTSTKYEKKIDYRIYKYTVYKIHCAKSSQKMSNVQIQYSAQNTKMSKIQSVVTIQYDVQIHQREKSQALATPPLLSLVNYPQFSIHLYSFCILGTLHICTQYLYFQSICVLSVFYNLCLYWCSSLL